MGYLDLLKLLPGVESPKKRLTFRDKLKWTGIILFAFLLMGNIYLWGVDPETISGFFQRLEMITGSSMGTLMTLGIGPIVISSIILQLLVGSGVINWDMNTREGKMAFMGTQKILAILFCFFEATAFVLFGAIPPSGGGFGTTLFLILQIAAGGILIILMDETVSKWGFGNGVGLFIVAGVSKTIFVGGFNFLGGAVGAVPATISSFMAGNPFSGFINLIPVIFTLVVFLVVVYAQSIRVEVPLAFGQVRGFGQRWPLKYFYANVIPVILVSALLANLTMWGRMMASKGFPLLGSFKNGNPDSGLVSYITAPRQADLSNILIQGLKTGSGIPPDAFAWIGYTAVMIVGCIIFSLFWVNTAGMDAKSVARQVQRIGLSVPGFRRDPRIIERVLERYITPLTILGGASIGLLAAFADFTGALGSGTGILLAVMIIYQLYEEIAQQHMEDMHPALRKFMGR